MAEELAVLAQGPYVEVTDDTGTCSEFERGEVPGVAEAREWRSSVNPFVELCVERLTDLIWMPSSSGLSGVARQARHSRPRTCRSFESIILLQQRSSFSARRRFRYANGGLRLRLLPCSRDCDPGGGNVYPICRFGAALPGYGTK